MTYYLASKGVLERGQTNLAMSERTVFRVEREGLR
jgi:hypothetical protein